MAKKQSCKAYSFTDADGITLTLSETPDRYGIVVSTKSTDDRVKMSVILDAAQFTEMCGLDRFNGLEVRTVPEPEPEPAPVDEPEFHELGKHGDVARSELARIAAIVLKPPMRKEPELTSQEMLAALKESL